MNRFLRRFLALFLAISLIQDSARAAYLGSKTTASGSELPRQTCLVTTEALSAPGLPYLENASPSQASGIYVMAGLLLTPAAVGSWLTHAWQASRPIWEPLRTYIEPENVDFLFACLIAISLAAIFFGVALKTWLKLRGKEINIRQKPLMRRETLIKIPTRAAVMELYIQFDFALAKFERIKGMLGQGLSFEMDNETVASQVIAGIEAELSHMDLYLLHNLVRRERVTLLGLSRRVGLDVPPRKVHILKDFGVSIETFLSQRNRDSRLPSDVQSLLDAAFEACYVISLTISEKTPSRRDEKEPYSDIAQVALDMKDSSSPQLMFQLLEPLHPEALSAFSKSLETSGHTWIRDSDEPFIGDHGIWMTYTHHSENSAPPASHRFMQWLASRGGHGHLHTRGGQIVLGFWLFWSVLQWRFVAWLPLIILTYGALLLHERSHSWLAKRLGAIIPEYLRTGTEAWRLRTSDVVMTNLTLEQKEKVLLWPALLNIFLGFSYFIVGAYFHQSDFVLAGPALVFAGIFDYAVPLLGSDRHRVMALRKAAEAQDAYKEHYAGAQRALDSYMDRPIPETRAALERDLSGMIAAGRTIHRLGEQFGFASLGISGEALVARIGASDEGAVEDTKINSWEIAQWVNILFYDTSETKSGQSIFEVMALGARELAERILAGVDERLQGLAPASASREEQKALCRSAFTGQLTAFLSGQAGVVELAPRAGQTPTVYFAAPGSTPEESVLHGIYAATRTFLVRTRDPADQDDELATAAEILYWAQLHDDSQLATIAKDVDNPLAPLARFFLNSKLAINLYGDIDAAKKQTIERDLEVEKAQLATHPSLSKFNANGIILAGILFEFAHRQTKPPQAVKKFEWLRSIVRKTYVTFDRLLNSDKTDKERDSMIAIAGGVLQQLRETKLPLPLYRQLGNNLSDRPSDLTPQHPASPVNRAPATKAVLAYIFKPLLLAAVALGLWFWFSPQCTLAVGRYFMPGILNHLPLIYAGPLVRPAVFVVSAAAIGYCVARIIKRIKSLHMPRDRSFLDKLLVLGAVQVIWATHLMTEASSALHGQGLSPAMAGLFSVGSAAGLMFSNRLLTRALRRPREAGFKLVGSALIFFGLMVAWGQILLWSKRFGDPHARYSVPAAYHLVHVSA